MKKLLSATLLLSLCLASCDIVEFKAPADGGKPFVERPPMTLEEARAQSVEVPAPVANRSKERYVFRAQRPVKPGDYLRKRV